MRTNVFVFLVVLTGYSVTATAQTANPKLVHQTLETAGVLQSLEQMPAFFTQIAAGMQHPNVTTDVLQRIQNVVRASFEPGKFKSVLETELAKELNDQTFQEMLQWYETPLAKKVAEVETAAGDSSTSRDRQTFLQTVESDPPAKNRIDLVRSIDSSIHGMALMADAITAMINGMLKVSGIADPRSVSSATDIGSIRRDLLNEMQQVATLNYLFTYRSLSDDELRAYSDFLSSGAGKDFYDALERAYATAFKQAGETMQVRARQTFSRKPF